MSWVLNSAIYVMGFEQYDMSRVLNSMIHVCQEFWTVRYVMGFEQNNTSWVLNSTICQGFKTVNMSRVLNIAICQGYLTMRYRSERHDKWKWQNYPPPFTCWTSASKSAVSLEPCLLASNCFSFLSTIWLFFCKMVAIGRKWSCIMSGVELAMIGCVRAKTNAVFVRILNVLINSWKNVQVEYSEKVISSPENVMCTFGKK